jgi:hypothetical protein
MGGLAPQSLAQETRFDTMANLPFKESSLASHQVIPFLGCLKKGPHS